jgi:hypothetical protein
MGIDILRSIPEVYRISHYLVLFGSKYEVLTKRELVSSIRCLEPKPNILSGRISTGVFGLTDCDAGNRGPKGLSEVLIAVGNEGLNELIRLGFIPCPVCKPDQNIENFWDITESVIKDKYGYDDPKLFADKNIIAFDTMRVNFEKLLPYIGQLPNRLYIPQELSVEALRLIIKRLDSMKVERPRLGYYDRLAPDKFAEYGLTLI